MANKDEIKAAYHRGYRAGKKRTDTESQYERIFMRVFPDFLQCEPWTQGAKRLYTMEDRTELAKDAADLAIVAIRKGDFEHG